MGRDLDQGRGAILQASCRKQQEGPGCKWNYRTGRWECAYGMKARGHEGHRPAALRAPEALPSGRAAVPLFWPDSTASANRKRSVRNFPATLGGAFTSCRGPPEFRHFVRTSQTHTFLKSGVLENVVFQKSTSRPHGRLQIRHTPNSRGHARRVHVPQMNRFRIPTAVHMQVLRLSIDEFVSPR